MTTTTVHLFDEGAGETGVVHLGTPVGGEQYGWECARCDRSALAFGDPDRAQAALDEHECVENACPECPTGVVENVGRMERETGHQPYACNAGCGFYG